MAKKDKLRGKLDMIGESQTKGITLRARSKTIMLNPNTIGQVRDSMASRTEQSDVSTNQPTWSDSSIASAVDLDEGARGFMKNNKNGWGDDVQDVQPINSRAESDGWGRPEYSAPRQQQNTGYRDDGLQSGGMNHQPPRGVGDAPMANSQAGLGGGWEVPRGNAAPQGRSASATVTTDSYSKRSPEPSRGMSSDNLYGGGGWDKIDARLDAVEERGRQDNPGVIANNSFTNDTSANSWGANHTANTGNNGVNEHARTNANAYANDNNQQGFSFNPQNTMAAVKPTATRTNSTGMKPVGRQRRGKIIAFLISYDMDPNGEIYEISAGRWLITSKPTEHTDYILLEEDTVSPLHAFIRATENGKIQVLDQLSENGTFVSHPGSEEEVEIAGAMAVLEHGSRVRFGNRKFVVSIVPPIA